MLLNLLPGMRVPAIDPARIGYVVAGWIGLEILAFSLIVHSLGFLATLVLALATTMLGLSDVRRLLDFWRRPGEALTRGMSADGGLQALGAFLLILPGFVSDFAGLALKSPSVRADLARRFGKGDAVDPPSGASPVIDLSPREWKNIDDQKPRSRRGRRNSKT